MPAASRGSSSSPTTPSTSSWSTSSSHLQMTPARSEPISHALLGRSLQAIRTERHQTKAGDGCERRGSPAARQTTASKWCVRLHRRCRRRRAHERAKRLRVLGDRIPAPRPSRRRSTGHLDDDLRPLDTDAAHPCADWVLPHRRPARRARRRPRRGARRACPTRSRRWRRARSKTSPK